MISLIVNPRIEEALRPLTKVERENLRRLILDTGRILDSLKVWRGPAGLELLDGHNRYDIYLVEGSIPDPAVVVIEDIKSEDDAVAWIEKFQRARRNLTPDQILAIDIQEGRQVVGHTLKRSQALALRDACGEELDHVVSGKKTLTQAFNDWRRKEGHCAPPAPRAKAAKAPKGRIHVVIGDTQVKPGVPTAHLGWIGRYIAEQFVGENVAIVHLGDHWDMPSLSSYDIGKKGHEGRRYIEDVKAGNEAFALLNAPIAAATTRRWKPELHFLFGNHEHRIVRACEDTAHLDGKLSLDDLDTCGWTRHVFLAPVHIDGVVYSHYFYHPKTGRPYGGDNLFPRLKTIGHSFTMGHQQGRKWAEQEVGGRLRQALVLGSTYLHDEEYLGPQGNSNWRGIVVCHQVEEGQYDPMFVSLDYLCRRYEGQTVDTFTKAAA